MNAGIPIISTSPRTRLDCSSKSPKVLLLDTLCLRFRPTPENHKNLIPWYIPHRIRRSYRSVPFPIFYRISLPRFPIVDPAFWLIQLMNSLEFTPFLSNQNPREAIFLSDTYFKINLYCWKETYHMANLMLGLETLWIFSKYGYFISTVNSEYKYASKYYMAHKAQE